MRRGPLLATGIAATLGAVVSLGAAAALLLVVGSDEALESPVVRPRSDGVALVVDDLRADADFVAPDGIGSLVLVVRGEGPVFVGEAMPAVLDEYLAGAPYDAVVSLGPVVRTSSVPGTQQPPPPGSVDIWVRSATGSPARLDLPATAGTSLVVMRVDARPGVEATVSVLLRLPGSWTAGWIALGLGLVLLVLAVLAFVRARRSRPTPRHAAGATGSTPDVLPGLALPVPTVAAGPVPADPPPDPAPVAPTAHPGESAPDRPPPYLVDDPSGEDLAEADPSDADVGLVPSSAEGGQEPTLRSPEDPAGSPASGASDDQPAG